MRRRVLLVGGWLLATALAVTAATLAVGDVGRPTESAGGPTPSPTASTTVAPTSATSATTTDVPSSQPTSSMASPTTPPPTAPSVTSGSEVYQLGGGTVGVSCTGDQVRLDFAIPRDGYAVSVEDEGPGEVSVRFRHADGESRVDVACNAGTPVEEIRED